MNENAKSLELPLDLPEAGDYRPEAIRSWFGNIARELKAGIHPGAEGALLRDYYAEAGLLRSWRRSFFFRHYAESLSKALSFLFAGNPQPTILDLGCGTGSQSLLFALHGARVIGVDMDTAALRIFRRRLDVYQQRAGRTLPVSVLEGNVFELDYGAFAPLDGVYSLFAFNMMQPSARLVDLLLPHFASGARWAVLDGNQESLWCRFIPSFRRPVWRPSEMRAELERGGFKVVSQEGGIALPPASWTCMPERMAQAIDRRLCRNLKYPISCQTLAVRA